jgi:hypothetical protein
MIAWHLLLDKHHKENQRVPLALFDWEAVPAGDLSNFNRANKDALIHLVLRRPSDFECTT